MWISRFWDGLGRSGQFSVGLAIAMALLVVLTVKRPLARWLIPALAFFPVPVVALFSTQFDLAGWQGFMHTAPIYRMMNGGPVPPEEPLFAGGSIRYPWVEQWLVAQVSRITGANVHVFTLAMEVVAYAVLLGAGWWLASAVSKDRGAIALAVLFTGFGIALIHVGPLLEPFTRAVPGLWLETRVVPLDKFANITAMPLGYAAMTVAMAASVRLGAGLGRAPTLAAVIATGTLIAAFIHPLSWFCLCAFAGAVGASLLLFHQRDDYLRLAWLTAAVLLPSALAFPYLRSVGISESSDGWSGLTRPAALWLAKLGDVTVYLAPLAFLTCLNRAKLREMLGAGNRAIGIVLWSIPCMAAGYLLVRFPARNEYKFLLCLVPAAAAMMGLYMRELLDRQRAVGGVLLAFLLMPGGQILGSRPGFMVTEEVRTDGRYLRALAGPADDLYQWIARETPPNAVFITAEYGVPALGRRGLYIAVNTAWRGRNGWGLPASSLLQFHVRRPDAVMALRQQRADVLLGPSWSQLPSSVVRDIEADVPGRPLFVHTSDRAVRAKLDGTSGFRQAFSNAAGAVYAVTPSDITGPSTSFELVAFNEGLRRLREVQPLVDQSARLLREERASEALAIVDRALRIDPRNADVLNNLCVAHGLLGHREQAVNACEKAVALNPHEPLPANNLAWVRRLPPQ
jgi:tetratricopeptide repeat protein